MPQQRYEELTGQGCANAACSFARLLIGVSQYGKEVEATAAEGHLVDFTEHQIAHGVDADEQ